MRIYLSSATAQAPHGGLDRGERDPGEAEHGDPAAEHVQALLDLLIVLLPAQRHDQHGDEGVGEGWRHQPVVLVGVGQNQQVLQQGRDVPAGEGGAEVGHEAGHQVAGGLDNGRLGQGNAAQRGGQPGQETQRPVQLEIIISSVNTAINYSIVNLTSQFI